MKAMVLRKIETILENPPSLQLTDLPVPQPQQNELLIQVSACGVCHTELDEIEGRTPPRSLPIIPGHQVVGRVVRMGESVDTYSIGDRVGVAWIFSACGECKFCLSGQENLCPQFQATGRDVNGGYAEFIAVSPHYAYPIPEVFSDIEAAPLLCAGAIGYRSLKLSGIRDGNRLGLSGFGGSGHITLMLVKHLYPHTDTFVFSRTEQERTFAMELGAYWSGDFDHEPPGKIDAVIDTTPVWKPLVTCLRHLEPGGRLVINAIRKENIDKDYLLEMDYATHMWMEKEIKSVANVTRQDVIDFLDIASRIPLKAETQTFKLEDANQALYELKTRKIRGAKVLSIN